MQIEVAGVPAEVVCQYPENEAFFRDYLTEKTPEFSIAPTREDLERIRHSLARTERPEHSAHGEPAAVTLENHAIHYLLAEKLTEFDVLLVHASALAMDGEAYLFAAPSGTGKSTHARLWRETFGERVRMLNDDKPLLRITKDGVFAYGSPWNGKHCLSSNACAPLKAIAFLNRSASNHIALLSKAEAFPLLMQQAFFTQKLDMTERIIAMEEALLETTPVYRLDCNISPEAATLAWNTMRG